MKQQEKLDLRKTSDSPGLPRRDTEDLFSEQGEPAGSVREETELLYSSGGFGSSEISRKSSQLPYTLGGIVRSHDKQGRLLGYPTANLQAPDNAPTGVFVGTVKRGDALLPAMMFIGEPVTTGSNMRRAEAHILDFPDQDLYGEELTFTLLELIRSSKKFSSVDKLLHAMQLDEGYTRKYFKANQIDSQEVKE